MSPRRAAKPELSPLRLAMMPLNGSPVYDLGRRVALAWTDYDNDGFFDLVIVLGDAVAERKRLYRNNGNARHWLKVKPLRLRLWTSCG